MTRLPTPGQDSGNWGTILNDFLQVAHNPDGSLANNIVDTNQIKNNAVTNTQLDNPTQTSLTKANTAIQTINSKIGTTVTLTASDVAAVPTSQLGAASGVATLDNTQKLTSSQVPSSVVSVSSGTPSAGQIPQFTGTGSAVIPIAMPTGSSVLAPVVANASNSPLTLAVNQLAEVDTTGGDVVVNCAVTTTNGAQFGWKLVAVGTGSFTFNLPSGTTFDTASGASSETPTQVLNDGKAYQLIASTSVMLGFGTNRSRATDDVRYGNPPYPHGAQSLIPNGRKLKMGNITVKPSTSLTGIWAGANGAWGALWFQWDWTSWIQMQIDRAWRILGLNGVKLIGGSQAVANGQMTLAQYLAQWDQLITYCASQNMWVEVCVGAPANSGNSAPTGESDAHYAATAAALCAHIVQKGYQNVIGIDLSAEADEYTGYTFGGASWLSFVGTVRTACKAAAPNLPMTFSTAAGSGLDSTAYTNAFDPFVDFWEPHTYSSPSQLTFQQLAYATTYSPYGPKPILVGEFGSANQISSPTGATARYLQVLEYEALHPACMGVSLWALANQDSAGADANNWGVIDNRQAILTAAVTMPLSGATINVDSTAGLGTLDKPAFASSGTIYLGGQPVTYTGITSTSFTGCTGGVAGATGTFPTGYPVVVETVPAITALVRMLPSRQDGPFTTQQSGGRTLLNAANAGVNNIATLYMPMACRCIITTEAEISCDVTQGVYEVDTLSFSGATTGVFNYVFTYMSLPFTAGGIPWNETAAAFQTALQALTSSSVAIPSGGIKVTGGPLPAAVTISMAGDAFGPVTSQAVSGNTTGGTPTLAVVTAGVAPTQYTVATNITSGVQYLHGATAMETATITGPGRRRVSIRDEVLVQASVFAQWTTRIVMAPSTVGLPPAGSGTNGVLEQWKTLFEFYPL